MMRKPSFSLRVYWLASRSVSHSVKLIAAVDMQDCHRFFFERKTEEVVGGRNASPSCFSH